MRFHRKAALILPLIATLSGCTNPETRYAGSDESADPDSRPRPGTLTVNPSSGTGTERIFQIEVNATRAEELPTLIGLLINDQKLGNNACYVFARLASGTFSLVNDNGVGSSPLDNNSSIANGQCELVADDSSVVSSETGSDVRFHIRFKPRFAGYKRLYSIAYDQKESTEGLGAAGEWHIPREGK